MSYTTVKDGISAILAAIVGVVNVHDYLRYSATLSSRDEKFYDADNLRIDTWMITRVSAPSAGSLDGDVTRSHRFLLHGYRQIEDVNASEVSYQELVELVLDTFNDNRTIDSAAHIMDSSQLIEFSPTMFSGVLCHHAVIEITVEDDVDP